MQPAIDIQTLTNSRIQLHYAIQLIAATGAALATPQPDYSHTSLHWNADLKLFEGVLIPTTRPFHVAINPVTLGLLVLDAAHQPIATFTLSQHTLAEGLQWLKTTIAPLGADAEAVVFLSYPPDDFPDHPIAHGAAFDASQVSDRQQLARYYHETHGLLQAIATQTSGASPVYTWPHHFDMATLISLPGEQNGEALSIGVGFSPGDSSYAEPYWYVTPWPYPDPAKLPPLESNGTWHTHHWVGAILTASQLDLDHQVSQLNHFLKSSIHISQQLLMNS